MTYIGVSFRYNTSPSAVAYDIVVVSVFCRKKSGTFDVPLTVSLNWAVAKEAAYESLEMSLSCLIKDGRVKYTGGDEPMSVELGSYVKCLPLLVGRASGGLSRSPYSALTLLRCVPLMINPGCSSAWISPV